jgi:hypothetical protein
MQESRKRASSASVIWYIVSFRQFRTDRPEPRLHTPLKSLYICCTATDAIDASTCLRRYSRGKHHRSERGVEVATCKCIGQTISSLCPDYQTGRADLARHPSPLGSTFGRIAQFDERVAEVCSSHSRGIGRTARRLRILTVASIA